MWQHRQRAQPSRHGRHSDQARALDLPERHPLKIPILSGAHHAIRTEPEDEPKTESRR